MVVSQLRAGGQGRGGAVPLHDAAVVVQARAGGDPGYCWLPPSLKITFAPDARLSGTTYLYRPVLPQPSVALGAAISTPGQAALFTAVAPSPVYTYA